MISDEWWLKSNIVTRRHCSVSSLSFSYHHHHPNKHQETIFSFTTICCIITLSFQDSLALQSHLDYLPHSSISQIPFCYTQRSIQFYCMKNFSSFNGYCYGHDFTIQRLGKHYRFHSREIIIKIFSMEIVFIEFHKCSFLPLDYVFYFQTLFSLCILFKWRRLL